MSRWLQQIDSASAMELKRRPVDQETLGEASVIIEDIRSNGEIAVRHHSERFEDLSPDQPFQVGRDNLIRAFDDLDSELQHLLERTADRIRTFAEAQYNSLVDVDTEVVGGRAGHHWLPVKRVGAYAPGGRHPLPSTVLMTVIPARVAGVEHITVASPKPIPVTLAAAALAGANSVITLGGAQAIAAMAFGIGCRPVDLIVGPGNRWVTAAKKHLYGEVGIDGLAGPSEIAVVTDQHADPRLVAADLIAQAEHDPDTLPILITTHSGLLDQVDDEISSQLDTLITAPTATQALNNGFSVVVDNLEQAAAVIEHVAPEHLALHIPGPERWAERFNSYGSIFLGGSTGETFADYGAGPNHVLPTGGSARYQSGLSVLTFLRSPTWLHITDPGPLIADTAKMARIEGLEAHARAAEKRKLHS